MVFDATFNNISAISWRSDLSVEETKVSGKKHYHIMLHGVHLGKAGFELITLAVIGTDCIV
jgi:hypothetical protein